MKNTLLFFALILATMNVWGQEDHPLLDKVAGHLETYRQAFPLEKVYVQTDKEVYAPGAILWFSALVVDPSGDQPSGNSPEITVNLYDASGNFITGDQFRVASGLGEGDLHIPGELPLGRYYLAAYTPLQIHPGNVFVKPLIIDRSYESDALVTFVSPGKIYMPGKEAGIDLKVTDYSGLGADKFQMLYEVHHGDKKLSDGKVRSVRGEAAILFPMPAVTGTQPVEVVVSHPKDLWSKKLTLLSGNDEIQVTFYPEGGSLIGTVPQKIGYYATAREGVPVNLDADIVNSRGEVMAKTKTFAPGYGLFPFKGATGEKYQLQITSEYGKGQRFDLPGVREAGVALVVQKSEPGLLTADLLMAAVTTPRKLAVAATRGAALLWAADLEMAATSRIRIPTSELGSGLIQLTVFDDAAQPLSSRLVYLPGKNNLTVRVSGVPSDDNKVKISVETLDENLKPVDARVILSVADQMRTLPPVHHLTSFLALESDLRNPSGLDPDPATLRQQGVGLDFILIANEQRCFSWERVLKASADDSGNPLNSMGISGRVTDKKGTVVPGAKISVMSLRDMQVYSATADNEGRFAFPSLQPVHSSDFTFTATDAKGKGNYLVQLDPTFAEKVGDKVRALDYAWQEREAPREPLAAYLSANPALLSPQPAIRPIAAGGNGVKNESYKNLLQTSTSLLEVIKSMRPFNLMNGQIVFPGTINSINFQSGALIVIDGQKMGTQADVLNSISPYDVDKINISLDPIDIQRYTGLNNVGLIEITTKHGEIPTVPAAAAAGQKVQYSNGYRVPRHFLTTDALENQSGKDLRTTLFWDPALKTGPTGVQVFTVPLSDIRSGFVIRAEAFTPHLVTGAAEAEFRVD